MGALILFHKQQFQSEMLVLGGISELEIRETLHMERETFTELEIFIEDWHPSMVKGRGRSKEGLSLFSCMNFTLTKQGYFRLRDMFFSPVTNLEVIRQRHLFIEVCEVCASCNLDFISEVEQCLKRIIDLKYFLRKVNLFKDKVHDWILFYESLPHLVFLSCRSFSVSNVLAASS